MFKGFFNHLGPLWFDKLAAYQHQEMVRSIVVPLALISFVLHICLIALGRCVTEYSSVCEIVGHNYLAAMYTPFSIILFYEIFEMVIILPESVSHFMAKQYEVISLIILRDVFKDLSHFKTLTIHHNNLTSFYEVAWALGTSMLLFLLVGLFKQIHLKKLKIYQTYEWEFFKNIKKTIAVFLAVIVIVLAIYSYAFWIIDGIQIYQWGGHSEAILKMIFFKDFFTIMVFVDIFLLIFSLVYTRDYEVIFRNAAFIASTILLRMSLSSPYPYKYFLSLSSVIVGILTLSIFYYHTKLTKILIPQPIKE